MPEGSSSSEGQVPEPTGTEEAKVEDQVSASEVPDANSPADTSAADGTGETPGSDEQPKTTADIIDEAVKAERESRQAGSSPESGEDGEAASSEKDPEVDADPEKDGGEDKGADKEEDQPPFHKHPRWQALISERDTLKEEAASLKDDAEAYKRLDTFMTDTGLEAKEVNEGLQVMAWMRSDPQKALQAVEWYRHRLMTATGQILPKDLSDAVEQGLTDEAYARQLAQARIGQQTATQRAEAAEAAARQAQDTARQQSLSEGASYTADAWERSWQVTDPDYSKKADAVKERIELQLLRDGVPGSKEDLTKLLDSAKAHVENQMRSFLPKKREISPGPSGSSQGTAQAAAQAPKSMMDVIDQVVGSRGS